MSHQTQTTPKDDQTKAWPHKGSVLVGGLGLKLPAPPTAMQHVFCYAWRYIKWRPVLWRNLSRLKGWGERMTTTLNSYNTEETGVVQKHCCIWEETAAPAAGVLNACQDGGWERSKKSILTWVRRQKSPQHAGALGSNSVLLKHQRLECQVGKAETGGEPHTSIMLSAFNMVKK